MSQLVVCRNANGIILAADSRAVDFVLPEKVKEVEVPRLFQIDRRAGILTGGAVEGFKRVE